MTCATPTTLPRSYAQYIQEGLQWTPQRTDGIMSNTFDPFADLNPPTNSQSASGAVRRASAQTSLDNNMFFGAPQVAPPAPHSNRDPFASLNAPTAPHRSSAGPSTSDDPFAMLGGFNKPGPQNAARPAMPAQSWGGAGPTMGAPMRSAAPHISHHPEDPFAPPAAKPPAPAAPTVPAPAQSRGWGDGQDDPFGSSFASPAAAPLAPQQQPDNDPFGSAFSGLSASTPSNQSACGAVRRASAQASLDNNMFFGAPQAAPRPAAPHISHHPEDPFAPPAAKPPAPAAPTVPAPAQSGGWGDGQDDPFGSSFASPAAAPLAPQQQPDNDPFAAFGNKPAAPPPPPAPPAQTQSDWGSDDPFGSFPAKQPAPPAPAAQSNNDWGFGGDDDFFSPPPPVQAAAAPTAGRSSLQSPAHRNAPGEQDAEEAMRRLRELYPTDDDADGGAPAARDSHRPAGGRYATDNKTDTRDNNNLPTEGGILARLSTRSLFVKDWQEAYWVLQNNHLLLFRNKNDYEYNPGGTRVKKDVLISPKLRCQKVHMKEYSGYGNLYNFMLEEIEDFGPVNVAKFASRDRAAVDVLYVQLTMNISKAARAASSRNQY